VVEFVPMKELLADAVRGGYAVPSFCVWNAESARVVLEAASDLKAPVVVMCGPGEFRVLPPEAMAGAIRAVAAGFAARAALHLDHGDSPDLVRRCLDAGFTSVMLDYSARPFDENVEAMCGVAAMARPAGATVEGELGAIGRADDIVQEGGGHPTLTDPDQATEYVRRTGVDALAVSIGNAHGVYTTLPRLDFERLAAIRSRVDVPLVLHGGSGTPEEDLRRALSLGIVKVNVASELVQAVRGLLEEEFRAPRRRWLPQVLGEAAGAAAPVVARWIRRTGAAGRA